MAEADPYREFLAETADAPRTGFETATTDEFVGMRALDMRGDTLATTEMVTADER